VIDAIPDVRFTESAGLSIAYEVLGHGDLDIVLALGVVPNLEHSHEFAFLRRWVERLSSIGRLIQYDRRGVGLSDYFVGEQTLEDRMDDIRAVLDAAGSRRAALVTSVEGGPIALLFAATYPERTASLALYASYARARPAPDSDVGIPSDNPESLHRPGLTTWGTGETFARLVGHPDDPDAARRRLARLERTNSSPLGVRAHFTLAAAMDVRSILPSVQARVLAIARTDAYPPPAPSRWLADHVPDGRFVEVPGRWLHSWNPAYEDEVLDEVEAFLIGGAATRPAGDRFLATLVFTDIVDSTAQASALGDGAWRSVLDDHDRRVREVLMAHSGTEVNTTGDGFFATFDGPARAIRAAHEMTAAASGAGVSIRAGVHTGECERRGSDVAGIAVHLAARVAARAGANEVLATATVRDLVVGSGLSFEELGPHELKGIPGEWQLVRSLAPGS
jgi:class 3 adenylate cyclase